MKRLWIRKTAAIALCMCLTAEGFSFSVPVRVFAEEGTETEEISDPQREAAPEENGELSAMPAAGEDSAEKTDGPEEETGGAAEKNEPIRTMAAGAEDPADVQETVSLDSDSVEVAMDENRISGGVYQYYYTGKAIKPAVTLYCFEEITEDEKAELQEKLDKGELKQEDVAIVTRDGEDYRKIRIDPDEYEFAGTTEAVKLGKYTLIVKAKESPEEKEIRTGEPGDLVQTAYTGSRSITYQIVEKAHSWGAWTTTAAATALKEGQKQQICTICGAVQKAAIARLKATIKFNMSKVTLKRRQSTTKFKVSGLANGDYVKSYKSSNKKIFTVSKKGKITAKKKSGTAKLTVRLASGLKKTVKVKVQKGTVKTTSISLNATKLNLQKGKKYTLKATRAPLTSQQKVTYKSSNKKIATVNSKGVITAKKRGTVTITATSGKKKKKCKVTVTTYPVAKPKGNSQAFLNSCNKLATTIMNDKNWTYYSGSRLRKTFEAARAGERLTSCANFVNYCMQDFGSLAVGMLFYSDGNGQIKYQTGNDYKGNEYTRKDVEAVVKQNYDIIPIGGKTAKQVAMSPGLEPGDICLWNGHTNVFAGFANAGKSNEIPMWYDAGRASTAQKKPGSVFTNMYRASWVSSLKIYYILRLKK